MKNLQAALRQKWCLVLLSVLSWAILVWVGWNWGLTLLKLPVKLYFWLWNGVLSGQMSLWLFIPSAVLVWLVWFFALFICIPFLRVFPQKAATAAAGVLAACAGLILVGSLVHLWLQAPYTWQSILARLLWTWGAGCGTVWAALMLLLGANER